MIGGNIIAELQIRTVEGKNSIGEGVTTWQTVNSIRGFLDYTSGDSKYTNYDAKMQDSTHVFVADYTALDSRAQAENSRLIVNGKAYDVMLIDDPMELHKQLEIYLKYTGGQ